MNTPEDTENAFCELLEKVAIRPLSNSFFERVEALKVKAVHPHRDNIIKYHACSDADKLRWQFRYEGHDTWTDLSACGLTVPPWDELTEYRLLPNELYWLILLQVSE